MKVNNLLIAETTDNHYIKVLHKTLFNYLSDYNKPEEIENSLIISNTSISYTGELSDTDIIDITYSVKKTMKKLYRYIEPMALHHSYLLIKFIYHYKKKYVEYEKYTPYFIQPDIIEHDLSTTQELRKYK